MAGGLGHAAIRHAGFQDRPSAQALDRAFGHALATDSVGLVRTRSPLDELAGLGMDPLELRLPGTSRGTYPAVGALLLESG